MGGVVKNSQKRSGTPEYTTVLTHPRLSLPEILKMALKCGIVGLPNVGKSTLFNCLSDAKAQSGNFPFCTIEPNLGVIAVPDDRLTALAEIVQPQNVLPTTVDIVDIAGLVKGASKGDGLGNQFLSTIRETDAILHVLRCFDNDNIIHVDGSVDPVRDKEVIDIELQLKDLESVQGRLSKVKRAAGIGDKEAKKQCDLLLRIEETLEAGRSVRSMEFEEAELPYLQELQMITAKPVMYVCNVDEASVVKGNAYVESVRNLADAENAGLLIIGAGIESDIAELDEPEERLMFLEEMGLQEAGVAKLIREAYKLLKLQTYFTAGVKEVRAWTVKEGATAPEAAGVIHTDFEKGFIRAEVMKYDDFISYGSEQAVKEAGKLSVEGKAYVVADGDIMHFLFNV